MDYDDGAASRFDLQKVREFKGPLRVAAYVIAFAHQQQYGSRNTLPLFQENQRTLFFSSHLILGIQYVKYTKYTKVENTLIIIRGV